MNSTVEPGSRVTLHYRLSFVDGTVIDDSREGDPLTVTIGQGELVEFLEHRLLGLAVSDKRHFEIPASETGASGHGPGDAQRRLPRSDFPPDLNIEAGQVIAFASPTGEEVPAWIQEVNDREVVVDFSHPLMGRDLVFDVESLSIETG